MSQINNGLYSTFVQPWLKAFLTPQITSVVLALQPLRLKYALFSDKNPFLLGVAPLAEKARVDRKTLNPDNPILKVQEQVSEVVTKGFEALGDLRDHMVETIFHTVYGSPWLQAWLGVTPKNGRVRPKPGTSPDQIAALAAKNEELRTTMDQGDSVEAEVRALVYIVMGQRFVDARSFEVLRRSQKAHPEITLARFKAIVREQWARLTIDQEVALKALTRLLPEDASTRRGLFKEIRAIETAAGALDGEARRRLEEMEVLFDKGAVVDLAEKRS